jgi:hypothetical protein
MGFVAQNPSVAIHVFSTQVSPLTFDFTSQQYQQPLIYCSLYLAGIVIVTKFSSFIPLSLSHPRVYNFSVYKCV